MCGSLSVESNICAKVSVLPISFLGLYDFMLHSLKFAPETIVYLRFCDSFAPSLCGAVVSFLVAMVELFRGDRSNCTNSTISHCSNVQGCWLLGRRLDSSACEAAFRQLVCVVAGSVPRRDDLAASVFGLDDTTRCIHEAADCDEHVGLVDANVLCRRSV